VVRFSALRTGRLYPQETFLVDCIWNAMARTETRFRLSTKWTGPFKSVVVVSSVDYWQASSTHQPAGFVLLVPACVLQSCDAYWLPTPFSCFPFTSPVRHRVPSHCNWTLLISVTGWVIPRAIVRPEGLWQWKIPMTHFYILDKPNTPYSFTCRIFCQHLLSLCYMFEINCDG
jgi:hypothetical protein